MPGRRGRRQVHDARAMRAVMAFIEDFQPDVLIWGGDQLDLSAISHWNAKKHHTVEGLRVLEDIRGFHDDYLAPIDALLSANARRIFLVGNHEVRLDALLEEHPALEGMLDLDPALGLTAKGYEIVPQGEVVRLGKLYFLHGDTIRGGKYRAAAGLAAYERSIRFGHFHTYQTETKMSAIDLTDVRTAVAVPCLCRRGPSYGKNAPNRWITGFNWGYIHPNGTFTDYVSIITRGRFTANGVTYAG